MNERKIDTSRQSLRETIVKLARNKIVVAAFGLMSIMILLVLTIASGTLAQTASITVAGGDTLEVFCEGRGFQVQRQSQTLLTLTCVASSNPGNPTQPPQPTETSQPPLEPTQTSAPPAEPTATSSPTPVAPPGNGPIDPYVGAPACEEIGLVHDPRVWHGIWDYEHGCHWDHEHKDNPHDGDHLFGTQYYQWAGGEISYPWQTFTGANYLNPPQPAPNSGIFENDTKHNVYGWRVDLGEEGCTSGDYALSPNCIESFRLQFHGSGNHVAAVTIFHSMYIEALGQTLNNDCDNTPGSPNRCYAAAGGWIDFGRLRMKGMAQNDPASRFRLPGENPAYDDIAIQLRPYRSHPVTTIPVGPQTLHSWNSSGNYVVSAYGEPDSRVYYGFGFHIDDGWGPFDPDHRDGHGFEHITCGTAEDYYVGCEFNSSSLGVFRAYISFPPYLDGSKYDQDNKPGFVTIHGYTNRYGDIVTYTTADGQIVGNCTMPSLDCVPVVAENFPVQETGYRGTIVDMDDPNTRQNDLTEYDIYFCNGAICNRRDRDAVPSGWIKFPN